MGLFYYFKMFPGLEFPEELGSLIKRHGAGPFQRPA